MDEKARALFDQLIREQKVVQELTERLRLALDEFASLAGASHSGCPPAADSRPIEVFLLGTFEMRIDGKFAETWRHTKAAALFQYLLAHRHGPSAREVLIDALWPDPAALAAGSSLKVAVHSLRQHLVELGGSCARVSVQAQPTGYQLCGPDFWVDAEEFERYCRKGRLLDDQGRVEEANAQFVRAADLYRGDFLESSQSDWAVLRRESLKDQYLFLVGRLAEAAFVADDNQGCITRCQQLLEHDACREDAYRLLMAAHGRLGQRARVQSWYDVCVRTLSSNLDCAPEPQTDDVYQQALRSMRSNSRTVATG